MYIFIKNYDDLLKFKKEFKYLKQPLFKIDEVVLLNNNWLELHKNYIEYPSSEIDIINKSIFKIKSIAYDITNEKIYYNTYQHSGYYLSEPCYEKLITNYNKPKTLIYEKMKKLNTFNEFQIDMIFENNSVELPFILSKDLIDILEQINHPISKDLLRLNKERNDNKITFVDIDNKIYSENEDIDVCFKRFSILYSNKTLDNMDAYFNIKVDNEEKIKRFKIYLSDYIMDDYSREVAYIKKNRVPIKIGSFIQKIFKDKYKNGGDPGNDIESFVNSVVSYRKNLDNITKSKFGRFKLVSGDDIVKYYNEDNYYNYGGSLNSSCMRYYNCEDYIKFYANIPNLKLLILFSKKNLKKISGRALVWENLLIPEGRTFMDRIYTTNNVDNQLFIMYAEENGWLYKRRQNMEIQEDIVDTKDDSTKYITISTQHNIKPNSDYPYLDTLAYYDINNEFLTNNENIIENNGDDTFYYKLKGTEGDDYYIIEKEQRIYVEYYKRKINIDDLTWCEYGNDYRLEDDVIKLSSLYNNKNATKDFVENNMEWSNYYYEYIMDEDTTWSEFHQTYLIDSETIKVINDAHFDTLKESVDFENNKEKEDIRETDDIGKSVIEYNNGRVDYYFDEDNNDDVFVQCIVYKDNYSVYKHLIWDKNSIIKDKKGNYIFVKNTKNKDELLGQTRLFDNKNNN